MPGGELRRVADPTDSGAVREAFIATYGTSSETLDAAALVEQYERVQAYCAEHPDQGSGAVATALDLPRSRLRGWVDGDSRPDAVRGVETLTARGWLHLDWQDRAFQALAGLVAWVVAGGSVEARSWYPTFSASPGTSGDLHRIGDVLGIAWQRRHTDTEGSGEEWVPDRDGSVLGRLLGVLGAPVGGRGGPALPTWIIHDDCPRPVRLDMARIIVRQRGTRLTDRPSTPVRVRIAEPGRQRVVVDLFRGLVGRADAIKPGQGALIRLEPDAVELLGTPPAVGDPLPGCEQSPTDD